VTISLQLLIEGVDLLALFLVPVSNFVDEQTMLYLVVANSGTVHFRFECETELCRPTVLRSIGVATSWILKQT
jgi:hypothetical protein